MATTTFVDGTTVILATWANDVDEHVYKSQCATRTALKAVDTTQLTMVELTEAGREGKFVWTTGNYATRVAADVYEGVFIPADAIASTAGCWVRQVPDGTWHSDWFGVPDAGGSGLGTDGAPQAIAMFNTANIDKPAILQFDNQITALDSALPYLTYITIVQGVQGGAQPSILYKRYVEADADRGVIARQQYGGTVRDISVQGLSGTASGGSGIIWKLNTAGVACIGDIHIERVNVSMSSGGANQDILLDGVVNNGSPLSLRKIFMNGVTLFGGTGGAARNALVMRSVSHVFGTNMFIQDHCIITGTATVGSDDIHLYGVLSGKLSFGNGSAATSYITRSYFHGPIFGDLYNEANTSTCAVIGQVSGIHEVLWDTDTCLYLNDSLITEDGSDANGVWVKYGDSRNIEMWGSVITDVSGNATVTFPNGGFPSTVTFAIANVSTAPAANHVYLAQAHTYTTTTMGIRAMDFSTVPVVAPSPSTVKWYAKGR